MDTAEIGANVSRPIKQKLLEEKKVETIFLLMKFVVDLYPPLEG